MVTSTGSPVGHFNLMENVATRTRRAAGMSKPAYGRDIRDAFGVRLELEGVPSPRGTII